jgi:hypothetical protein
LGFWFFHPIQIREDTLTEERPRCPRGCSGQLHRHGCYFRYENPSGDIKLQVQRFYCPPCQATVSVLPANHLPYRPVKVDRLQADFDQRAQIDSQGPDPPPNCVEAGCLKRAWSSLATRWHRLAQDRFAQGAGTIRTVDPQLDLERLFFTRLIRLVRKDGTVRLDNILYEVNLALRGLDVELHFDPWRKDRIEVRYKGQDFGLARRVNRHLNSQIQGSIHYERP